MYKTTFEYFVNQSTPRAAKIGLTMLEKDVLTKESFWKIFEGEMLFKTQTTTLLYIFCELLHVSQVIFNRMKVADDTC